MLHFFNCNFKLLLEVADDIAAVSDASMGQSVRVLCIMRVATVFSAI
jgi:hypothetical protein